ncbi:bifunctional nitrate reductase/sulfite reductase flavoprotein subunit alpha [Lichenihabitans sp. Uapishka_5]|uniref:bifunctional nitrate reductase/sulfite reductase flavoprotein subunit alpha n=1 Tax=Lichenihabitans sp. Uapishka_5 TaxID=3037302 RepID=UPI0029E7ECAF|nr:bifunctional nitrate reductase/sulfite reductase flavoprotein subunit alpha [Lichenihabitans sp. Uapishka_5]MDX7951545.1 bifunctional nitrate reductase/sulfite reductase flavoprotein subunit alpha [Lichenihabitans sp. Uapishka_5]
MATAVKGSCPYCGVGCGIVMQVEHDRITKVSGDKTHPTNFGRLCTKGNTCAQAITGSGRLEKAHLRRGRGQDQVPVDREIAIAETARRLRAIIDRDGPDAVAFYVSGQMSLEAQYLANKLAKGFIRTRHIESNSRLCMASAGSGYKLSLGSDGPPGSYQDFDTADLFLVIGSNMADCHPILFLRMMDRIKKGARLIVVDPRRSATADKASLFLQIRPGTDLALLNGLLHLLHRNNQLDRGFIASFTEGWEAMPDFLADYGPEAVSAITGLAVADIVRAAAMIAAAPEVMTCWTMGLNQSIHGTWNANAICNLHLATGKICRTGSGPFSLTGQPNAMGGREMGYMGPGLPGQRSALSEQDRAAVEALWQIPAGSLRAEAGGGTVAMFKDMAAGAIKACWIICTNPVASVANRDSVIAGLRAAELVVTQDAFLDTETNIYADILLPGALWAEGDGVTINSERTLTLTPKAVEPPGDALPDWMLIARVAQAMGYGDAFTYASAAAVFDEIRTAWNPATGYDIRGASHDRLRDGPLQWPVASPDDAGRNPIRYLNDGVSQARLTAGDGSVPRLAFATPSGKARFFARPHAPAAEMPDRDFPLVFNTGRLQHQWHTMTKTGKVPTLNKLNPGPFVEIHPEDAAELRIRDADKVEIRSRRGKAVLPAVVTDRVRAGTCFAPFHWNDSFGDDLAVNVLTNDAVDPVSLQPGLKLTAVAIRAVRDPVAPDAGKEMPRVKPFSGPQGGGSGLFAAPATGETLALRAMTGLGVMQAPAFTAAEQRYLEGFILGLDAAVALGGVEAPALPPAAPFAEERRLLVDGMLAGLFSRRKGAGAAPAPAEQAATILVAWASQTGTAEAAAGDLAKRLTAEGHAVRLCGLEAVSVTDLAEAQTGLFLVSTFGDGEPPDNGVAFWDRLTGGAVPSLAGLRYAVCGFGDPNYDQFCGFGRKLDQRLADLGAARLRDRLDCEPDATDAAGLWSEAVGAALRDPSAPGAPSAPLVAVPEAAGPTFSRRSPYGSILTGNRLLTGAGGGKEVRQFVFATGDALAYQAGDALGVWPRNDPRLVAELLDGVGLKAEAPVRLDGLGDMPVGEALERHLEIGRASPDFAAWWRSASGDVALGQALSGDREAVSRWLWGKQVADIVRLAPGRMEAQSFIQGLKRLQPRLYSIASSPKRHPGEVHLTVSVVRYGANRSGTTSSFLADRAEQGTVPVFIQPSAHFRPPADPQAPAIMIGPGTGIAPFRAFLQDREAQGASGRNWLFFGEQHRATDFYYRDELQGWLDSGHLTRLDLAFSRDQAEKVYVQDKMLAEGETLWRWLEAGAYIYLCGDAGRMAKDVGRALQAIVARHGGMTEEAAAAYMGALSAGKRFLKDVY